MATPAEMIALAEQIDRRRASTAARYAGEHAAPGTAAHASAVLLSTAYPSLAVEIVSKVHMLRPLVFATASSTKRVAATSVQHLVVDVRKQQLFMEKILGSKCLGGALNMESTVIEYLAFLRQAGSVCGGHSEELMEPSLVVDVVWHVHMQMFRGSAYGGDSIRIAGRLVDHAC